MRVENFIRHFDRHVGRPVNDRCAIARAFIAKNLYNIGETKTFIEFITNDAILRRLCGWDSKRDIPSESTFSRAFAEFAKAELSSRMHESFIKEYHGTRLVGEISRDSTAIEAREKSVFKPKKKKPDQSNRKRGRPKKGTPRVEKEKTRLEKQISMNLKEMLSELPKGCDIGAKKDSKGFKISWKGYKLHIDTGAGDIPISAILTSASVHDSGVALPLLKTTETRVTHFYELMDSAYDALIIRNYVRSRDRIGLIDFNRRGQNDNRHFEPHEAERYKARSAAERVNSQLKDNYAGNKVRVKGNKKVMSHLMFGILVLSIEQTLRLLT